MPEFESHMTAVEFIDGNRQSDGFRPAGTVVMINYQALIVGTTVHAGSAKQTAFERLALAIQDHNCHLEKIFK